MEIVNQSDWTKLPQHVWVDILKRLDSLTVARLMETCNFLHTTINNTVIINQIPRSN